MTKFAFSTLGCAGLPVSQVAELAVRHGFSGVELRCAVGEPVHVGLSIAERRRAAAQLRRRGVEPLCVASYVQVADVGARDTDVVIEGIRAGQLAADLGAPYLRVFPGGPRKAPPDPAAPRTAPAPARSAGTIDATATRRLAAIADGLADTGVTVALETHDSHPRAVDAMRIVQGCADASVIWDTLHTWRAGESPAQTMAAVGDRLAYVQVKDVASATELAPLLPGDGSLPLDDVAHTLRHHDFHGWISWEYEQKWFPEAPALRDVAGAVAAWLATRMNL